ncbi:MAG: DUF6602 domain-containing protein [Planctomycetota bacterium]
MISSFQKLVEELIQNSLIDASDFQKAYPGLRHGPTLGDMYEDITRKALKASMLESFDLNVVDGFIQWDDKTLSSQQDTMIVLGSGTRIPGTNRSVYQAQNVIATVEVKKTLARKNLEESLAKFCTLSMDHVRKFMFKSDGPFTNGYSRLYYHACRYMLRRSMPLSSKPPDYSSRDSVISTAIALCSITPLKIVWGFDGYKTEHGLAKAFVEIVQEILGNESICPPGDLTLRLNAFPDLVISNEVSIVRANGMPFAATSDVDNAVCLYGSHHVNPIFCLLNILWYRILLLTSTQGFSDLGNGQVPTLKELVVLVPADPPVHGVQQPVKLLFQDDFSWERNHLPDYEASPMLKTGPVPYVTLRYAGSAEHKSTGIDISDPDAFLEGLRRRLHSLQSTYFEPFFPDYNRAAFSRAQASTYEECIAELLATNLFYIVNDRLYTCAAQSAAVISADGEITIGDVRFGGLGKWFFDAAKTVSKNPSDDFSRG